MSLLDTTLAVVAFLGFFATVEYTTYRVIEREHRKRSLYRLFFVFAWTGLALVHMWVVAPLLNLPPTAAVGVGVGILIVFFLGLLDLPFFRSVGVIGLYPFAQVYELFVILLLLGEWVAIAASFVSVSQLEIIARTVPSNPQIQAALGLGVAAAFVALTFYDPSGKNGYYYLSERNLSGPRIDSEAIRKKIQEKEANTASTVDRQAKTPCLEDEKIESSPPGALRAPVRAPNNYEYNWTYSVLRFDDIGGYYDVKHRLAEEVLQPVRAATRGDDRYDRFGIEPSRGILFHGPPGTGKTLFARALAGELNVPFAELGPADMTSKWINEGPQRVRQLFEEAASVGPCIIFLDEAEHLFGGRNVGAGGAHAEDRKITSELLVHLTAEDRTAIVIGATNRPEDIDPAIVRPGRIATHVEIGLPREESRHAILQAKLDDVPHELTGDQLAILAGHTAGLSGAEIEELVTDAKRKAARRDAQTVSVEDFPSPSELDAITEDIRSRLTSDINRSDECGYFSENAFDDDSTVGFQ